MLDDRFEEDGFVTTEAEVSLTRHPTLLMIIEHGHCVHKIVFGHELDEEIVV